MSVEQQDLTTRSRRRSWNNWRLTAPSCFDGSAPPRGVADAQAFDDFVAGFDLPNFAYDESLSNAVRHNRTPRVFTANEAPQDVEIFLHHEMAQTPYLVRVICFSASL